MFFFSTNHSCYFFYMYFYCSDFLNEKKTTVLKLFIIIFCLFLCCFRIITYKCLNYEFIFKQNKQVWFFILGPHANYLPSLSIRLKHSEGKRRSPCPPWLPVEWPSTTVLKPSQSVSTKLKIVIIFLAYISSTQNSRNLHEHFFQLELNIRNYQSSKYFFSLYFVCRKETT